METGRMYLFTRLMEQWFNFLNENDYSEVVEVSEDHVIVI